MKKFWSYVDLVRLNKPIGIWLFLWPTLCALWLTSAGIPSPKMLIIFVLGVVTMRSAGCVINDWWDQKFDGHVARTKNRPLVTGRVTSREAWVLFFVLSAIAVLLVAQLNLLSLKIACLVFCLTLIYPLMKRWTNLPQFFLGAAVAGAVPMAFAAVQNYLPQELWWVYAMALLWPIIYDTLYAMVDRQDDAKIGLKSTALLLGEWDRFAIVLSQILFIAILIGLGNAFSLRTPYYFSVGIAVLLFFRQNYLIRNRDREACFKAFSESHWLGFIVFLGISLSL